MYESSPMERADGAYERRAKTYATTFVFLPNYVVEEW